MILIGRQYNGWAAFNACHTRKIDCYYVTWITTHSLISSSSGNAVIAY